MYNRARLYGLVASLMLGAAISAGPVTTAGSEAKAQELDWATSAGSGIFDSGLGIATDLSGNSYVTGIIRGSPFGVGVADVFVAKYAPDGSLVWATSADGMNRESGSGIAADPRGNSYVTGMFEGTATFGAGEANATVLTGSFQATATFGAGEANETTLESEGGEDVFVAKYAPDGTLLWVTSGSGPGLVRGNGIAADPRGNSYVAGSFRETATFGAGEANETVLNAAGDVDVFVAKYGPDGTFLWAMSAGGANNDSGISIATDPTRGNSYVTGSFQATATFGAGEASETTLESEGGEDVFVAKYARDGTLLWARSAGGASGDGGNGIATNPRANSYVTGAFRGLATFGAGEANETTLDSAGDVDVFVAKYGSDGTLVWATRAGGIDFDLSRAVATHPRGDGYVAGLFEGTATFGAGEANETTLESAGSSDIFVAKYRP